MPNRSVFACTINTLKDKQKRVSVRSGVQLLE
jgi:hypothetical protein